MTDPKNEPQPRVTMRMVAEAAGVSVGTVSLALRDQPRIPAHTRQRISELAQAMGYRPDAYVSALMAQLHTGRRESDSPLLGLVIEEEKAATLEHVSFDRRLWQGAKHRAHQLGYVLEVFPVEAKSGAGPKLAKRLHYQNVRGVILGPVFRDGATTPLPLDGFACCALGDSLQEPDISRVRTNFVHAVRLAWAKVIARGYRRPGMVCSVEHLKRTDYAMLGPFLSLQARFPTIAGLPPLMLKFLTEEKIERAMKEFMSWYRKHSPDVLVFPPVSLLDAIGKVIAIPGELAVVLCDEVPGWTQVDQMPEQIGSAAVDTVIAQIHRNECGIPPFPKVQSTNCGWVEGDSLPNKVE